MKKITYALIPLMLVLFLTACRQMPFGNKEDVTQSTTAAATTAKPVETTTKAVTAETQTTETTAKTTAEPVTVGKTLTGISVNTLPAKTGYFTGDTLDTAGLVISANYSDGTKKDVSSGFKCAPEKLGKAGSQDITVTYGGKTTSFKVDVGKLEVTSVKLKSAPRKTDYYVGDLIDTAGLSLTVAYNNGKSRTVADGFTVTPKTVESTGTQKITVTYGGKTASFEVNGRESPILKIRIKTAPEKKQYLTGEMLDPKGLTVDVTYSSGKTATVSDGFTFDKTLFKKEGREKVTLSYAGKTTFFYVDVKKDSVVKLSVLTMPIKTVYYQGEKVDTTGLTLTAVYESGKTRNIDEGYSISPKYIPSDARSTQTIKVGYNSGVTSFTVTVRERYLSSIGVRSKPNKTEYFVNETLNTSGLTLNAYYSDGSSMTVTDGYSCSPTKFTTAGTVYITVTYKSKTTSFYVTVKENSVKEIRIINTTFNKRYYYGDTIDLSYISLDVTYMNGNHETVNSGFDWNPKKAQKEGSQTITITYKGASTSFMVNVVKITKIIDFNRPKYYAGENLADGMTIRVLCSDGVVETYSSGFRVIPEVIDEPGEYYIRIFFANGAAPGGSFQITAYPPPN